MLALKVRLGVPIAEGLAMDPRLSDALIVELHEADEAQRRDHEAAARLPL